jgi:hypothetical protein
MQAIPRPPSEIPLFVEVGKRRVFAGAVDWPGWCRSGRDEASALEALFSCGPRYAQVLEAAGLPFDPPAALSSLVVVEHLPGSATTDFGAPDGVPAGDEAPIDAQALGRFEFLLRACWLAFGAAVQAAEGRSLRKGPRGGGRDLPAIVAHVVDANKAYLRRLAWKPKLDPETEPAVQLDVLLDEALQALAAAAAGEMPERGPRGGKLWLPRYFVRRVAWHMLDHAWEIEDRME